MFEFFSVANTYRKTTPVFIIGAARSGTTILWRILQKHSSFRLRESNLVETSIFAYTNQCDTFSEKKPENLFRFMLSDEKNYGEFLRVIAPIRRWQRWIKTSFWAKILRKTAFFRKKFDYGFRINGNDCFVLCYFYFAQKARGAKRLLEKSPNNIHFLQELLICFPESKMLYIYRHPIEVYSSYKKRLTVEKDDADWCNYSSKTFIEKYRSDMTQLGIALNTLGNRLLVFRYEDFTANPTENYRKICEFIGEEFEEEAVKEEKPDLSFHIDPHLFGAITSKTKDWQKYVSEEEAREIEDALEEIMENYGYSRFTEKNYD
jgi:hypothetical protein